MFTPVQPLTPPLGRGERDIDLLLGTSQKRQLGSSPKPHITSASLKRTTCGQISASPLVGVVVLGRLQTDEATSYAPMAFSGSKSA